MTDTEKRLELCMQAVADRIPFKPRIALVLGSGLGAFADEIRKISEIPYGDIPHFPVSTVSGHDGRFIFGYAGDVPVVVMKGRVHYYEGYTMEDVVLPIRLMRRMGAEILFLTNAAGGLNKSFVPGDLMLITDQISSFVPSPLIGPNPESLGTRFPDITGIYTRQLQELIKDAAAECGIGLREGVYIQFTGPNYESPAEIRMAAMLGADAVGMSTAVEAIAGRHAGFAICGISCITNMAAGISGQALSHDEVKENSARTAPVFRKLLWESIQKMAGE